MYNRACSLHVLAYLAMRVLILFAFTVNLLIHAGASLACN